MRRLVWCVAALVVVAACGGDDAAGDVAVSTEIPDLVGLVLTDADDVAEAAELDLRARDASPDDRAILSRGNWTVVSQEPSPGAVAEAGSTVQVTVRNERDVGEPTSEMPHVTGMLLRSAEALGDLSLTAYDLAPVLLGEPERAVLNRGNWVIITQCPAPGGSVSDRRPVVGVLKLSEVSDDLRARATNGELEHPEEC
jgi:beta-lactam-binding protein with PASTA domain